MEILIITQKVDKHDPVLGFFHKWIEEFSKHFEKVTVICLEKGEHSLPKNVRILSLGKESQNSGAMIYHTTLQRLIYLARFYKYIWQKRAEYSHIFVHMNQEYVVLAGIFWRLMGKRIYLWRNHAKGNFLTRGAVQLSHKVFYTSPQSFTAKFKKAVQMPVGIDTNFFRLDPNVKRMPNSILFLGRIAPVKRVLEFVDWAKENNYTATLAGPILDKDKEYGNKVLKNLNEKIKYVGPVSQEEALKLYQTHETYVNFTPSGSMDKTIFEAAACGMKLKVDNPNAQKIRIEEHSLRNLMNKLKKEL